VNHDVLFFSPLEECPSRSRSPSGWRRPSDRLGHTGHMPRPLAGNHGHIPGSPAPPGTPTSASASVFRHHRSSKLVMRVRSRRPLQSENPGQPYHVHHCGQDHDALPRQRARSTLSRLLPGVSAHCPYRRRSDEETRSAAPSRSATSANRLSPGIAIGSTTAAAVHPIARTVASGGIRSWCA
jgi:hypothetical protein